MSNIILQVLATLFKHGNLLAEHSQTLSTDDICDYNWHDVEAIYKDGIFVLNIDSLRPLEMKIKSGTKNLGSAEVYVGGKPSKYIREFF